MKIKLWGVRGSIASPGPQTARYGGNTPCLQVINKNQPGDVIILEAGTGIRKLGISIMKRAEKPKIHILLSHTHWDHIQGLPFFIPLFTPGFEVNLYGPVHYNKKLSEILSGQMDYAYFPVTTAELLANITYRDLKEERLALGGVNIQTQYMNHPVITLGYRLEKDKKTFVYTGDNEPYQNVGRDAQDPDEEDLDGFVAEQNDRVVAFARESDLLVADCQYRESEYAAKTGWGHSSVAHTVALATRAHCRRLILFHHEPERTDDQLEKLLAEAEEKKKALKNPTLQISLAKEQDEYEI